MRTTLNCFDIDTWCRPSLGKFTCWVRYVQHDMAASFAAYCGHYCSFHSFPPFFQREPQRIALRQLSGEAKMPICRFCKPFFRKSLLISWNSQRIARRTRVRLGFGMHNSLQFVASAICKVNLVYLKTKYSSCTGAVNESNVVRGAIVFRGSHWNSAKHEVPPGTEVAVRNERDLKGKP